MELLEWIKKQRYRDIKCMWYRNLRFSFTRGLRTLNCDNDVLQMIKGGDGWELLDLYVENYISEPERIDVAEIGHEITFDDEEVHHTAQNFAEVDDEVERDNEVEVDDEFEVNNEVEMDGEVEVDNYV